MNGQRLAPGGPGIEPRWTRGTKVAAGTAYSTSSRVWYTLDAGCVTEVYYPTIDTPQIREFLITDGETFFHDERRNFETEIDCISKAALGFEITLPSILRARELLRGRFPARFLAPLGLTTNLGPNLGPTKRLF